ncbi:hypothetical protein SCHPADRAFT_947672 [Schizopora paradoxa]|uniref:Uncharacterized protein n=1 Tax=Schizopora paradoxa TaxID=27342 RepID=A0A0H2QY44_9AGAM|nr:hypothetical protein SCHPADRAFT_947672 [Schizopora paradoxa]
MTPLPLKCWHLPSPFDFHQPIAVQHAWDDRRILFVDTFRYVLATRNCTSVGASSPFDIYHQRLWRIHGCRFALTKALRELSIMFRRRPIPWNRTSIPVSVISNKNLDLETLTIRISAFRAADMYRPTSQEGQGTLAKSREELSKYTVIAMRVPDACIGFGAARGSPFDMCRQQHGRIIPRQLSKRTQHPQCEIPLAETFDLYRQQRQTLGYGFALAKAHRELPICTLNVNVAASSNG